MTITPKRGEPYTTYIALQDAANGSKHLLNPTIVLGEFKVSTDGGDETDLVLPIVVPANSGNVQINFSSAQMTGNKAVLSGRDANGEWADIKIPIDISVEESFELIIPNEAAPGDEPVIGVDNFVTWMAHWCALSINEIAQNETDTQLKTADGLATLVTYATTDTGIVFTSGKGT